MLIGFHRASEQVGHHFVNWFWWSSHWGRYEVFVLCNFLFRFSFFIPNQIEMGLWSTFCRLTDSLVYLSDGLVTLTIWQLTLNSVIHSNGRSTAADGLSIGSWSINRTTVTDRVSFSILVQAIAVAYTAVTRALAILMPMLQFIPMVQGLPRASSSWGEGTFFIPLLLFCSIPHFIQR